MTISTKRIDLSYCLFTFVRPRNKTILFVSINEGDYQKQKICVPVGNCRPCELDNPNCVGKRDGPQAVPNKPEYFMQCKDERTISVTQCPPTAPNFDVTSGSCTVTLNPCKYY